MPLRGSSFKRPHGTFTSPTGFKSSHALALTPPTVTDYRRAMGRVRPIVLCPVFTPPNSMCDI